MPLFFLSQFLFCYYNCAIPEMTPATMMTTPQTRTIPFDLTLQAGRSKIFSGKKIIGPPIKIQRAIHIRLNKDVHLLLSGNFSLRLYHMSQGRTRNCLLFSPIKELVLLCGMKDRLSPSVSPAVAVIPIVKNNTVMPFAPTLL